MAKAVRIAKMIRGVIVREFRVSKRVTPAKRRLSSAIRAAEARARDIASRKNLVAVLRRAYVIAVTKKRSAQRAKSLVSKRIAAAVCDVLKRQKNVAARLSSTGCRPPRCVTIKRKSRTYCACPNVYAAFQKYYKRRYPHMTRAQIKAKYVKASTADVQRFKNATKTVDSCTHDPAKLCKILGRPKRRRRSANRRRSA